MHSEDPKQHDYARSEGVTFAGGDPKCVSDADSRLSALLSPCVVSSPIPYTRKDWVIYNEQKKIY